MSNKSKSHSAVRLGLVVVILAAAVGAVVNWGISARVKTSAAVARADAG